MPTSTLHLNLTKPDPTEAAKTITYNANLDKLEKGRTVRGIANESQVAHDAVRWEESTGRWRKALDTDTVAHQRGIAQVTAGALATQYGQIDGVVTNAVWVWTVGALIYVSGATAGVLTETAPTATSVPIGVAISATEIWLRPDEHIERVRKGLTYDVLNRVLEVVSTGVSSRGWLSTQYSADAGGAFITGRKSRGATEGVHSAVLSGDALANYLAHGSDGTAFQLGGILRFLATETWSGTVRGSRAEIFLNNPGSTTLGVAFDFNALGDATLTRIANAQKVSATSVTELTTIAAAAFTDTTILIPALAFIVGVSVRVVTVIPTAATFDVGLSGFTVRYHTGLSTAAGTVAASVARDGVHHYVTAIAVRITPNLTPVGATGQVRVTIHYIQLTGPTS